MHLANPLIHQCDMQVGTYRQVDLFALASGNHRV